MTDKLRENELAEKLQDVIEKQEASIIQLKTHLTSTIQAPIASVLASGAMSPDEVVEVIQRILDQF